MRTIAIDIGGTKIASAVIDEKFNIIKKTQSPTPKNAKDIISEVKKHIAQQESNGKIDRVGISMPGVIDRKGNVIFGGGSLKCLVGTNMKTVLKGKKVLVENDANCLVFAEQRLGSAKGLKEVLGIVWGTGIGTGIIIDGKIYHGANGGAGEFGHSVIQPSGDFGKCDCGKKNCMELIAGGKGILHSYKVLGGKLIDPAMIFMSKEKAFKESMDLARLELEMGVSMLINTLNPECIILAGRVGRFSFGALKQGIRKYALPVNLKGLKIALPSLKEPFLLGAVLPFFD